MSDWSTESVIKAGGVLLVATFLALIIYFVMSTPMESMFDSFDDADAGDASDEMNEYLPNIRDAMNIAFAVFIVTAPIVFILWVFHREPRWRQYRRY